MLMLSHPLTNNVTGFIKNEGRRFNINLVLYYPTTMEPDVAGFVPI
jgi:hypothetical protein